MWFSNKYRSRMWPYYILVLVELLLTVALLTLTGVAAPNLYRTKLWQDGANNGFNSSPQTGLYAAANYRPYTTPRVWSQSVTNYNLTIVILCMFILLVKGIMWVMHVLPPIASVLLHSVEMALYAVAIAFQGSSDMTDKNRPQNGPAWYITKSCSVTLDKSLTGYCLQAKATFACFGAMLGLYFVYWALSIWSSIPSRQRQMEKREKSNRDSWARLEDSPQDRARVAAWPSDPRQVPVTPRTFAFNRLNGKKDLPLRAAGDRSEKNPDAAVRSPGILKKPMELPSIDGAINHRPSTAAAQPQMYFPPPPKPNGR